MTSDSSPAATPEKSNAARWTPPVVWVVIILIGTSWPGLSLGPPGFSIDKLAHFGAYAVLAALILRATRTPHEWRTAIIVVLAVSLFGAVDEWHQSFIPRRTMSFADWVADTVGAIAGVLAVRFLPFLTPKRPA
jgi:VanZ family protein